MKPFQITSVIFLLVCYPIISTSLLAQEAMDIMIKVDIVESQSYHSSVRKWTLTTCKYSVKQGRMRCTEKPRNLLLENVHKDYPAYKDSGTPNKDSDTTDWDARSIDIIIEPIRDKGTSLLVYSYFAEGKDNDFWMYLPALGKVKRLISSSDSNEGVSLFGSEFFIEDAVSRKLKDFTYKLIGEEIYNKRPVWIIELIPTPEKAKKSSYSKIVTWIDKERYLILKDHLFDRNGKLYKLLTTRKVEQIDNIWIVTKSSMNNRRTRRVTNYEILSIGFNMEIDNKIFTQRTLTDFAFREKNLVKYRAYLK